jgi:phosphoglycolate phosphatase
MTVPAVVFDLDGTLVDTAPDLMGATNHVLSLMGRRPITMVEVRSFVGQGAKALIARGAAATGEPLDNASLAHYFAEFLRHYEAHIADGSLPFPGAISLLERLRANDVRLGVCTNKLERLSKSLIQALGLSDYFGAIIGPDTLQIAKPDPAPYRETVKRLGGNRSLMIGDSETDVLTARAAGVPVIAVSFGYTQRHVSSFSPDAVVDHFDELWPLIQSKLSL